MNLLEKIQSFILKAGTFLYEHMLSPIVNKLASLLRFMNNNRSIVIGIIALIIYLVISYIIIFKKIIMGTMNSLILQMYFIIAGVGFAIFFT